MLREAEKQFLSALKPADMVTTVLELSKVCSASIHMSTASPLYCFALMYGNFPFFRCDAMTTLASCHERGQAHGLQKDH